MLLCFLMEEPKSPSLRKPLGMLCGCKPIHCSEQPEVSTKVVRAVAQGALESASLEVFKRSVDAE